MKIGIFGDSFACHVSVSDTKLNTDTSWMKLINESDKYNITNFAFSGTSMYWSYNLYKQNYSKFDKNIFIATTAGRLYIPWNTDRMHWTSYGVINDTHVTLTKHQTLFNEVRTYYSKIYNHDEHQTYKELMLKDISSDSNTLLIDSTDVLHKITKREYLYYSQPDEFLDNRCCHMSQEGNNFLSERIKLWLDTGIFNINDWEESCPLPPIEKKSSYFIKVI